MEEVEHTPVSRATKESGEPQNEPEFTTVDSVKRALAELKELDVNNEYGVDGLLAMLDDVQAQIQAATSEEEMNAAFAQLHDLKEASNSIKAYLAVPEETEVDENSISIDQVDEAKLNKQDGE